MHTPTLSTQLYRVAIQRHPVPGSPSAAQLDHIHITATDGIDALLTARRITGAHNAFDPEPIGPIGMVAALTQHADVVSINFREAA